MESYETLLKGGKNGPVLIAGKALDSPMIHRLLLPLNDDDHMPPDGEPQPILAEIAALQWWIERGAPHSARPPPWLPPPSRPSHYRNCLTPMTRWNPTSTRRRCRFITT